MIKLLRLQNSGPISSHDRPFSPTTHNVELVDDPNKADYILLSPEENKYKSQINQYSNFRDKMVVWVNNDNPDFLDDNDGVKHKLISQPSGKILKHTTVPILMTDHVHCHLDSKFIEECRNQEKIYDYSFMGQIYGKREKLRHLDLPKYLFRRTGTIYTMTEEAKLNSIKNFLMELGRCKFGFSPRGIGSSSFRLFECLMVGTIPICTDVVEYPYESNVDWDSFTLRGDMEDVENLVTKSKEIDYDKFRMDGMNFWDDFIKMDNLHDNLLTYMQSTK